MVSRSDALSDLHFTQLTVTVHEGWIWESEMGMGSNTEDELQLLSSSHRELLGVMWGRGVEGGGEAVLLQAFIYDFLVDYLQRWPQESLKVSQPFVL